MAKLIKLVMNGGGPNNPSSTVSYNPTAGDKTPFYINVEKIRGVQYGELSSSTGNPVALYLWMAGAGGYNSVNTDSQVIKVWLTGTVAAGRNVGPEAADALINIINDSSVYGIVDYPVGSDWVVLSAEITWLP